MNRDPYLEMTKSILIGNLCQEKNGGRVDNMVFI